MTTPKSPIPMATSRCDVQGKSRVEYITKHLLEGGRRYTVQPRTNDIWTIIVDGASHEFFTQLVIEEQSQPVPDDLTMTFTAADARGDVTLKRGGYGPTILVNGVEIGYVDLYPAGPGLAPALRIFGGTDSDDDDAIATVRLNAGRFVLEVSQNAYTLPWKPTHYSMPSKEKPDAV